MTARAPILLLLVMLLGACGAVGDDSASPSASGDRTAPTIVIGTSRGVELELLAEVYAQAIEAAGYPVRREPVSADAGALNDELAAGTVDLAPGQIAALLTVRGEPSSGDATDDLARLRSALAENGLTALGPSQAARTTGFGLRHELASELEITTMSELVSSATDLTWGLPESCSTMAECRDVLSDGYGIDPDELVVESVPACDAAAAEALNDSIVDIAMLCTTQPEIERFNLVVLEDDRRAQPSGAFVPIINEAHLALAGDDLSQALDAVNDAMTTAELTSLVARVSIDGEAISDVARTWLEDHGLA